MSAADVFTRASPTFIAAQLGSPTRKVQNPAERLHRRVAVDDATGCWNWTGVRDASGYGAFRLGWGANRKQWMAHRASYFLLVGPIPDGKQIDHLCRNKACVNPAHLEPVTCVENIRRERAARRVERPRTHCRQGHALTLDNIYWTKRNDAHRRPHAICRQCNLSAQRAKRKAAK